MLGALSFDPVLPGLPVLDDPSAVARMLAPETDAALQVRRQDTKYEPRLRCVAGYELRGGGEAPGYLRLGAVVVTPEGVSGFPLTRDPRLPTLAAALDLDVVVPRLAALVTSRVDTSSCRARAVRYKPGTRCVIRYELDLPGGPAVLYGKLLAAGAVGQAQLLRALAESARSVADAPSVPAVLGVWPDLGMVLQSAAEQAVDLHLLAADSSVPASARGAAFERAGVAIAALHGLALPELGLRSWHEDSEELRDLGAVVAAADGELGQRYATVAALLEAGPPGEVDPVTSHGALRTDQLRSDADRLVLIDLDTLCRADPARDLGNLLGYLRWKAVRRPELSDILDTVGAAVLRGYARRRPLPPGPSLAWFEAASLLKIAGRRYRSLTVEEWPLVPALIDRAELLLAPVVQVAR